MRCILPSRLRALGVVGMNMRNVRFIAENNPRRLYSLVDDKLKTKVMAQEAGIAVPRLLGVVRVQRHVRQMEPFLRGEESFVVKPAKGSGGKGILVVTGRGGEGFIRSGGRPLPERELHRHTSNILSGLFSLGGNPDVAMLEEMIRFSQVFEGFTHQGVPDIRIIVYKGFPVMAMARLSTARSKGKANLHQGAVGTGIDMASGRALLAIQQGRRIDRHPDTGRALAELAIPDWEACLLLAARCHDMTGLGYLGVDIVLDACNGPLLLELNARPGLAIQLANGRGLAGRLAAVEALCPGHYPGDVGDEPGDAGGGLSVPERVRYAVARFGSERGG